MAFRLNKTEDERLDTLKARLTARFGELESAIDVYNDKVADLGSEVDGKLTAYNEALSELREFVDGVAGDRRNELDEKSEGWLEGENGQAATEWLETWENADLEEVKIDFPAELAIEFDNHGDIDLPGEP